MRIAIFDSGIGGVTVLHRALEAMPNEDYLYFADTDHVPYGIKSKAEILQYVMEAVDFIVKQDVKALVVACNTATSVAIAELRGQYNLPILGMEPAVKPALCGGYADSCHQRVLVTATPMTLREEKLHHLLEELGGEHVVDLLPLPGLVALAETDHFNGAAVEAYLQDAMKEFPLQDYCALVLGCTHFNFFKDSISQQLYPETLILDGSQGTVNHLQRTLHQHNLRQQGSGDVIYYHSGRRVEDPRTLAHYRQLLARLDEVDAITSGCRR